MNLARFSPDVVLCTNGGEISDAQRTMLADRGVQISEDVVDRLEGKGTALAGIHFKDAGYLEQDALFCHPPPSRPPTWPNASVAGCWTTARSAPPTSREP